MLDFSNPGQYALAFLPEAVLSLFAMFILLVDVFQKGDRSEASASSITWMTFAGVVAAAAANAWLSTLGPAPAGEVVALDGFRIFTNYVFLLALAFFLLISTRYLADEGLRQGELYVLAMFAVVGMMIFAGTTDLMLIFIGLELMSVPVYVLTGANRRDARSAEGALKYFLLGAFSSAFFLLGVALVFGATGTTSLNGIALTVGVDGIGASRMLLIGMAMLAVGFGFKAAAVPFHMWTPDAYEGAPAPIAGFMAAAVKAAAFAAFLRVFLTAFPGLYDTWDAIAIWLAVLTMTVANLIALVEGNVKRMLAYSSIAHAGYLLVALAAASALGAASFLFYALVYTIMTMGAFAVVIAVGGKREAQLDLEAYSGLGWRQPLLGVTMTVFLLSLAGFPFTAGFIGKFFLLRAAVERGLVLLAVVVVMASLVSYWYYLRVAWYMWFREATESSAEATKLSAGLRLALGLAAAAIVVLGVFPGGLLALAERSAATLMRVPTAAVGLLLHP